MPKTNCYELATYSFSVSCEKKAHTSVLNVPLIWTVKSYKRIVFQIIS